MEDSLAGIDVNLLVVLRAVLAERSATRAAKRLHVTQSAVSNALARLRAVLGDPLVVRHGRGLSPTPLALELRADLEAGLGQLDRLLARQRRFEPATSTRTFTVSLTDSYELSDLPRLVTSFEQALPRAQLQVITPERLIASNGLATGVVDAAILPTPLEMPGLHKRPLWSERSVLVVRRDHPEIGERVTREQFERLRHVEVRVVGEHGVGAKLAKSHLHKLGITRHAAILVPHFNAVAIAVAHSDAMGFLPQRFAEAVMRMMPLRAVGVPFPAVDFAMSLGWHDSTDADAGSRFFRELVFEAFRPGPAKPRAPRARRAGSR